MTTGFRYHFDWDPRKAATNRRKHGVQFEDAVQVFGDPLALTVPDEEHSTQEERWITLGRSGNGSLLVIVHTYEELDTGTALIRVISARAATKRETRDYETGQ
ncbi:MAG: BrnT family toxin [Wenzhouxiangella sp.]